MNGKVYAYNGRTWRPRPTVHDGDSFFHAVFGEGQPHQDETASFRRRCLRNFLAYFEDAAKPDALKRYLDEVLNIHDESDENFSTRYRSFVEEISSSERTILVKEIPLVAAFENVIIVVFIDGKETPEIFDPQDNFQGNYPWRVRTDTKEAVVCFSENDYSRLEKEDVPSDPLAEESILEEEEEAEAEGEAKGEDFSAKYYPKLSGCAGIKGSLYQIDLLTIYLLNGSRNFKSFRLSTENKCAGKFDDVVLEDPLKKSFVLQAKHKQNGRITYDDLYTTNPNKDNFSLPMYYLSYQKIKNTFDVQKMTLCTNTDLKFTKGSNPTELIRGSLQTDDPLYFPDLKHCCYTFSDTIVPILTEKVREYKDSNLKGQTFDQNVFHDSQVKEFLSKFQLVTGYSRGNDLDRVIEEMLYEENLCSRYDTRDCSKYLNNRMVEWFERERGRYLTQDALKIFLGEFRSNKFCEKLRNFQMDIRDSASSYGEGKRLVLIDSKRGYVLNMIKVYCVLYNSKRKYLFLSPNEDVGRQIETLEAFRGSEYDTLVACFKVSSGVGAEEISDKLTDLLSTQQYSYKKIILITGRNDALGTLMKEKNKDGYEEVFENITFKDLTADSQKRLLKRVVQFFHTSI